MLESQVFSFAPRQLREYRWGMIFLCCIPLDCHYIYQIHESSLSIFTIACWVVIW
jgi:hypothetical protein